MRWLIIKDYFVYVYYVIETNEVFYVGKGKKDRAYTGKRNKFCEDMKNTQNNPDRTAYGFHWEKIW